MVGLSFSVPRFVLLTLKSFLPGSRSDGSSAEFIWNRLPGVGSTEEGKHTGRRDLDLNPSPVAQAHVEVAQHLCASISSLEDVGVRIQLEESLRGSVRCGTYSTHLAETGLIMAVIRIISISRIPSNSWIQRDGFVMQPSALSSELIFSQKSLIFFSHPVREKNSR